MRNGQSQQGRIDFLVECIKLKENNIISLEKKITKEVNAQSELTKELDSITGKSNTVFTFISGGRGR